MPREMVRDLLAIRRDPLTYLTALVERFGDLVAFPMPRTPTLLVNDPDGARRVLVENARSYSKATVQYGALSAVTGGGLLTADGEDWRQRRRIAQPAFGHGALDGVATQAVAAGRRVLGGWRGVPDGGVVDVDAACMQATMEVVGRSLFDDDLAQDGEMLVAAVRDALDVVVQRARTPRPSWLPLPSARRLARALATLDRTCVRVVQARRALPGSPGTDLLSLLLRSADSEGGLTQRQVRDEIVTMVIAGHETVASCLSWTLLLLAQNPKHQQRVHDELDAVLGGREPGWDDLGALIRSRRVVDEALRLYPPAWVITRGALADDTVCGVAVPAGSLVVISPWLLHRRAASWPDPLRFDPERFAEPGSSLPRGDYLPFGVGPRLCIGRDFALVESVLLLATLLRGFSVRLPGSASGDALRQPPDVDAMVTLRPRGGLPLALHRR